MGSKIASQVKSRTFFGRHGVEYKYSNTFWNINSLGTCQKGKNVCCPEVCVQETHFFFVFLMSIMQLPGTIIQKHSRDSHC